MLQAAKRILPLYLSVLSVTWLHAQVQPGTATAVGGKTGTTAVYLPADYITGSVVNHITTYTPQQPYTAATDVTSSSRTVTEVNRTTQYFDGLGRSVQTVNWQANPNKQDIVMPVVYNDLGLEEYRLLPYAAGNDGNFKTTAFSSQRTFYSTTYTAEQPAYTGEQYYYSHIQYEPSPLNRVMKTLAPGNSWAGSEVPGTGRTAAEKAVSVQYLVNTTADHVRIWTIGFAVTADGNNIPTFAGTNPEYAAGALYKTVTLDEQSNATVEYKDMEGHVVLKKVQSGNGTIASDYSGYTGFMCTYYVYDDLGQLRFVIPPKAVAAIAPPNTWVLNTTMANELCYRYDYDSRRRMVAKHMPGADWIYMVYDARDRLVFTQDGNMRSKATPQWAYVLYDDLNRPVETGIMDYAGSRSDLVTAAASTITSDVQATLTVSSRDNGISEYNASSSITFPVGFSSEDNDTFLAQIVNGNNGYLGPLPASGYTLYPQTYTYYDNYSFGPSGKSYTASYNSKLNDGGGNPSATLETLPAVNSSQTTGLVTGTRVKVIEDPNDLTKGAWLETVTYYDAKDRPVQIQSDNYKGGTDISIDRYNFINNVTGNYIVHSNPQGGTGGANNIAVYTSTLYDHTGRVLNVKKNITYKTLSYARTIVQNTYDALGQLKTKITGQKSATDATAMESDDYNYNIRGWLKGANWYSSSKTYASQVNPANNKWFGFDLSYDWGMNSGSQYNGNIAGQRWKSAGDLKERAYGYTYDNASRLLKADFSQNNNSTWGTDPVLNFNVIIGAGTAATAYDDNGNIKQMQQWGLVGLGSKQIDNTGYSYVNAAATITQTNKLFSVTEGTGVGATDNKVGDFTDRNITGDDYIYDANGNLTTDKNKSIASITYNQLNLPSVITITGKGTITYIYDATGNKLEKQVIDNTASGKQTQTTYLGGFVYENNVLQYLGHEEGRVRFMPLEDGTQKPYFVYDYFLKDHLGNVRMVLTDEQKQDPYPAATLESEGLATEKQFYDIQDANIVDVPAAVSDVPGGNYPNNNGNPPYNNNPNLNTSATSAKMYKLNGAGGVKQGLGITLKVMAGDNVVIYGKTYYHINGTIVNSYPVNTALLTLLNAFVGGSEVIGSKGITGTALNGNTTVTGPLTTIVNSNTPAAGAPKASINYILFDEQFRPVSTSGAFGFKNVTGPDKVETSNQTANVTQNGYLYVYCSNESNQDVFFDNLQVIHNRGPLIEETHYYPFGLTMAGISSKALSFGDPANRSRFNDGSELQSSEFSDGSGLELYATDYRSLDPQLGRFWQIDPLADIFLSQSPYSYASNNPILFNDPLGDSTTPGNTLADVVVNSFPRLLNVLPSIHQLGAPALPFPEVPPLTIVPSNPSPTPVVPLYPPSIEEPSPIGIPGLLGRFLGVVGGVLWPTPVGAGSDRPAPWNQPGFVPYPGHGNNRRNTNPHIVYEFVYTPSNAETPVLKYGISDMYSNGMDRPQNQLAGLTARFGTSVTWHVYTRTTNREQALFIERLLVTQHVSKWGYKPLAQDRPSEFPPGFPF